MGVISCLSVIRGSFAQSWSVWEYEACPLSGIKKVRSWEVVSVYLDSDFNPCHSFIERLFSGGRVRYGRFHCIRPKYASIKAPQPPVTSQKIFFFYFKPIPHLPPPFQSKIHKRIHRQMLRVSETQTNMTTTIARQEN